MAKKIVDLIYLEPQKDHKIRATEINKKIDFWGAKLKSLQESYFEEHFDSGAPDVLEVMDMRKFLKRFLAQRVNWIVNDVNNLTLKKKYLKVLPPFTQKGGLKTLLMHFYQVKESQDKKTIIYDPQNENDKELRILWDIYKLRKTVASINTIKKTMGDTDLFPSVFNKKQRIKCLDSLKTVFNLLFQMCIQKPYQKELYAELSGKYIKPESIVERSDKKISLVYPHVVRKFNYRNHFFYVYFYSGMRAKIGGKMKDFHYNYLDFEIIKQEFLINWINTKLGNNQKKNEIYGKYSMGGKTLDQIILEDPAKEIEILQQMPLDAFNDITSELNTQVDDDLKTEVDPLSEVHGDFAEVKKDYDISHGLLKSSMKKLKSFIAKKPKPEIETPVFVEEEVKTAPEPEPPPVVDMTPKYEIFKIKKNQIDFPYFWKEASVYKQKLALQRVKLGRAFTPFQGRLSKFLGSVNESILITRRTPKHEWICPYHIKETIGEDVTHHLLLLGAEVKAKQLSMGYSGSASQNAYAFTCFFVYGCNEEHPNMGTILDKRNARGVEFNEFDYTNRDVQKTAMMLFDKVMTKEKM